MKTFILIAISFVAYVNTSVAQDQTPVVDAREKVQRSRIRQGRRSGELTTGETVKLKSQQRHIRRSERRAKADGTVILMPYLLSI